VYVKFFVELVHAPGIEKYQDDKDVHRTLLRKPKAQVVTANAESVELINQDNSKKIRHNEPDTEADGHQSEVCLPIICSAELFTHG
jgi:hypothetical protein